MLYGAGAAGFQNRNRAALALIFGMHILALFVWMGQRPARLAEAPRVITFLLRPSLPPPKPVPSEPAAPPRPVFSSPRKTLPPALDVFAQPPPRPAATEPAAGAIAPAAPATPATPAAPDPDVLRAPANVQDAIREQKEADGGFGLALSKRQAGRIDRALRMGKSGVPEEPDTPMGRFRRGLEAAHIDRSTTVLEDSYTSPDGVIIYRKRIGNKSFCRRSGSVSPLGMRGMLMANEAGDVPCPKGVQWKAD